MRMYPIMTAVGVMATVLFAQHEDHQNHTAPPAPAAETAKAPEKPAGMMASMPMMQEHEANAKLVEQLAQSFAAIEAEKNPAELQKKLAAHGVLLKQLQTALQGHGKMMDEMKSKMGAPAAGDTAAAPEHKH